MVDKITDPSEGFVYKGDDSSDSLRSAVALQPLWTLRKCSALAYESAPRRLRGGLQFVLRTSDTLSCHVEVKATLA